LKCLICLQKCSGFIDQKSQINYYYCSACQHIFKSPENFQHFEKQKERYDLHENEENDEGYQAYFQRFMDFALPLTGSPKRALDFGCGATSLLSRMLEKEGVECDFYDPVYHPDTGYKQKSYDLIVSTEVFEHLHNPREVFGQLLSHLNKGGYLAIQTQFHDNEIESFLQWYYRLDPTHIVFFSSQTFYCLSELYGCNYIGDNGKNIVVIQTSL
jgi:2-polyprenyl-3-methyl-5-hydroxy-6-metoxy-1,4-benzoquinol methylase